MAYSQPWLAVYDSTTYQHINTWDCKAFGPATAMDTLKWQVCVCLCACVCGCVWVCVCVCL